MIDQHHRDGKLRLLGHRDGVITALLEVRKRINNVHVAFGHVPLAHARKLAMRDSILRPLLELERILEAERARNQDAYNKGPTP